MPGVKPLQGVKGVFPLRSGGGPFTVSHSDICSCFFLVCSFEKIFGKGGLGECVSHLIIPFLRISNKSFLTLDDRYCIPESFHNIFLSLIPFWNEKIRYNLNITNLFSNLLRQCEIYKPKEKTTHLLYLRNKVDIKTEIWGEGGWW